MSWCDPTRPRKKTQHTFTLGAVWKRAAEEYEFGDSCPVFHTQIMAWKREKKTVGLDVFLRDGANLTDASGFNGVEQCEKGLSRRNSKVHHATFIQIALCFFPPPITIFLYFSLFSSPYPEMNCSLATTSTSSGFILMSVQISAGYSSLSLFIKPSPY